MPVNKALKIALIATGAAVVGAGVVGGALYFSMYPKEVYHVQTSAAVAPADAHAVAKKCGLFGMYGAKLATKSQLAAAQKAGAAWCSPGWVAEDSDAKDVKDAQFPMQDLPLGPDGKAITTCGAANTVNTCSPLPSCAQGITVYGKKPAKSDVFKGMVVLPWNQVTDVWNQPASK